MGKKLPERGKFFAHLQNLNAKTHSCTTDDEDTDRNSLTTFLFYLSEIVSSPPDVSGHEIGTQTIATTYTNFHIRL